MTVKPAETGGTPCRFPGFSTLSKTQRMHLARRVGRTLTESADKGEVAGAFFQATSLGDKDSPDRCFLALCIACKQGTLEGEDFPEIWRKIIRSSDSASKEKRMLHLLSGKWDKRGSKSRMLWRIAQFMLNEGYKIDIEKLANDLVYWNASTKSVQKRWAEVIYKQAAQG